MTRQELTNLINETFAEVDRLNTKYLGKRLTWGQVENIQNLKSKAMQLIEQRKLLKE